MNKKISEYETLIANVAINAGEKIINAINLYSSKIAYKESFFLLIIAQEELAKLILLPFAHASNEWEVFLKDRKTSSFYKHQIKQKIFTSFGLQNRDFKNLETIKQACLYVGPIGDSRSLIVLTKPEEIFNEISHAINAYIILAKRNIDDSNLSPGLKRIVSKFNEIVFLPAIKDLVPDVEKVIENYSKRIEPGLKLIYSNPFAFTSLIEYTCPNNYRQYFSEILSSSFEEALQKLEEYL